MAYWSGQPVILVFLAGMLVALGLVVLLMLILPSGDSQSRRRTIK